MFSSLKSERKLQFATQYTNIMSQYTIKAMVNKQQSKVLFAEADSEFGDILFSFLTLPLGKIAKLLEKQPGPALGSLSNLYRSVSNLGNTFFVNEAAKQMLLNPRTLSEDICRNFKLDEDPIKYFTCDERSCNKSLFAGINICMYYGSGSCDYCGGDMLEELRVMGGKDGDGLGFTTSAQSFFIRDDLRVEPFTSGFREIVRNFNMDVADAKEGCVRYVTFSNHDIVRLLRCCLVSETPLTDYILGTSQKTLLPAKRYRPEIPVKTERTKHGGSKYINLKISVHKHTNRFLFVQAGADFVELLFSFLTIPLGGVLSMLESNACGKSVENLHQSIATMDEKFFRSPDLKSRLLNPKLAPGYSCMKQFLLLGEETAPKLYRFGGKLCYKPTRSYVSVPFKTPKGSDNYVKERTIYMVTDDLTVTPFLLTSGLCVLNRLNIDPHDVDEVEVRIGVDEVLGILRASLASNRVLSTSLINHMPKRRYNTNTI